ncbi:L,D-transpeptidase catalytic domain [Nannocystis exedens]|uniref:L,D-transpeptidase catalytic domain n=1 Tax=Nannocystis exedens TaxID=54 RepID=A0A1I2C550_9BACT|nr:L,D-transpeptidase catalytic domain [Nannocystis exedens]SFE63308.1 L,D-transpeptidase catalytic domain [Nannocystis exedens]
MPGSPRKWLLALGFAACDSAPQTESPAELPTPVVAERRSETRLPEPEPDDSAEAPGDAGGDDGSAPDTAGTTVAEPAVPAEPAADDEIRPPEGYGLIRPPLGVPTPDSLKLHALAGYEVVTVYSRPDMTSEKLGYLRIGTRMMATEKIEHETCKAGFYGLPAGGYACASKGLLVEADKPPPMKYPPPAPKLDQGHPYEYGFVRRWNSPMWWRIPSDQEISAMEVQRVAREAERLAAKEPPTEAPIPAEPVEGTAPPEVPKPDPVLADVKLPLSPNTPWLERGFFLSLGEKVVERGLTFYRTARGAYVAAADISRYEAKDWVGVALDEQGITYPFAYVKKDTKLLQLTADDKLKATKTIERRTFLDLTEETEIGGRAYMITADGLLVRKDHLLIPELQALPKGLDPWERWIDVSVSQQMLVAYEGTRPVYVTLVSSGRKGTKEDPYETPRGRWRIYSKHVSTTMDGSSATDGNYSIQDVPWTMFFSGSYALHGAFWHRSFGTVRSHGCVNLGPSDARWLFHWTTPLLPEGWHGVNATDESPGSTVVVRD